MVRIRLFAAAFNSFSTNCLRVSFGWLFEAQRWLSLLCVSPVFVLSSFSWVGLGIAVVVPITAEVSSRISWFVMTTWPCVGISTSFPLFKAPNALLSFSIWFEPGIFRIAAVSSKTFALACCFVEAVPPCFDPLFSFSFISGVLAIISAAAEVSLLAPLTGVLIFLRKPERSLLNIARTPFHSWLCLQL